jgi:parallel beta-helix repeat protein
MARNHTLRVSCDVKGEGMKWGVGQVTIRNAYVHDNDCKGIWGDINAHNALIEDNLVEGNRAEGILYKISQDATIRNNLIYRNGFGSSGWYWGGGITVASSSNLEVYGNRLSGNFCRGTTSTPTVSASTTTRPTRSWSVENTSASHNSDAPISVPGSTVPRKTTKSSTPEPAG